MQDDCEVTGDCVLKSENTNTLGCRGFFINVNRIEQQFRLLLCLGVAADEDHVAAIVRHDRDCAWGVSASLIVYVRSKELFEATFCISGGNMFQLEWSKVSGVVCRYISINGLDDLFDSADRIGATINNDCVW